jgi:rhodanese-related sulfurtransferase
MARTLFKNLKKQFFGGVIQALFIGIAAAVLALVINNARTDSLPLINRIETKLPGVKDISPQKSQSIISVKDAYLMFTGKKAVFLDARDASEYEKYHIPGAIHIEPGKTQGKVDKIKAIKTEFLIAYCYGPGCPLAEELTTELKTKGIKNIAVMPEGWDGWASAGYPEEGSLK